MRPLLTFMKVVSHEVQIRCYFSIAYCISALHCPALISLLETGRIIKLQKIVHLQCFFSVYYQYMLEIIKFYENFEYSDVYIESSASMDHDNLLHHHPTRKHHSKFSIFTIL